MFNMILDERCAVTSKSENGSSGVWRTVNDVFLAGITVVGEDQVVDGCANAWMRIADLVWPEIKDLACPRRYVAYNPKVVHEGIELSSSCE